MPLTTPFDGAHVGLGVFVLDQLFRTLERNAYERGVAARRLVVTIVKSTSHPQVLNISIASIVESARRVWRGWKPMMDYLFLLGRGLWSLHGHVCDLCVRDILVTLGRSKSPLVHNTRHADVGSTK